MKGIAICSTCGKIWRISCSKEDNVSLITCPDCGGKHLRIDWKVG